MIKPASAALLLLGFSSFAHAADCDMVVTNSSRGASAICQGAQRVTQRALPTEQTVVPDEVLIFPSASSSVVASVGFIDAAQIGYFWSVGRGDGVRESFSTTLPTVDHLDLEFSVPDNVLNNGAQVDWNVEVNNVVVGSFTVLEGLIGDVSQSYSFAPIAGPNYTVELVVTNEVASGEGSVSLAYAGDYAHSIQLTSEGGDLCDVDGDGDYDRDDLGAAFSGCRSDGGGVVACLLDTIMLAGQCGK